MKKTITVTGVLALLAINQTYAGKMDHYSQPYSADQSLTPKLQFEKVLRELGAEQRKLEEFESAESGGHASGYQKRPVSQILKRIREIEAEKEKMKNSKSMIKFGAMMDVYYMYAPGRNNEGTSLDDRNYDRRTNDITMNLFELSVSGELGDKVSYYVDLDFGDFADQNQSEAGDGINHNISQAYLSYQFSDSLSVSLGKMYTHVGYKVAKSMDNWNYLRSMTFTKGGPFWHEGIALNYDHGNSMTAGLYLYDSSDNSIENN